MQSVQSDKNEANHLQGDIKSGNRYLSSDHKLRQMQRTRCYKTFLLKASQYFNALIKHLYLVFEPTFFVSYMNEKYCFLRAHTEEDFDIVLTYNELGTLDIVLGVLLKSCDLANPFLKP